METEKRRVFTLKDVNSDGKLEVEVRGNGHAITITPKGFGDNCSEDGHGSPILIELQNGVPVVYVWADINREGNTHKITLENAAEAKRVCDYCGQACFADGGQGCDEAQAGGFERPKEVELKGFMVTVIDNEDGETSHYVEAESEDAALDKLQEYVPWDEVLSIKKVSRRGPPSAP